MLVYMNTRNRPLFEARDHHEVSRDGTFELIMHLHAVRSLTSLSTMRQTVIASIKSFQRSGSGMHANADITGMKLASTKEIPEIAAQPGSQEAAYALR